MSPERTAVSQVRVVKSYNLAARPLAVLLSICCCLSAAGGQWLEKTIGLSDSFGSITPRAVYYVPSCNCLYVAGDDGVIVVDAATHARVARIKLDEPLFMAFDSHDNKIYLGEEDSLAVIDPVTHSVVSRIWVGGYPYRPCYNPAANKVYCLAGSRLDTLTVVDCSTDSVLASIWVGRNRDPYSGICCNPAGNKVYVSEYEEGEVAVIDGAGDSLLRTVYLGDYPAAPTYSPVSNKVYCADVEDEEVAVIDAGPDTLLKLIELDESPNALGYNPVSNKVYCGDCDGYVHIIDCYTDTILASLDLGSGDVMSFLFDSVDNRVFCFPGYYNFIPAICGTGDSIVGWVRFHGDAYDPDPACYNPQQNRLYVRGRVAEDVFVVDPATCELMTAIPMRPAPVLACYAEPLDRLYCSHEESGLIDVINCSIDSVERAIFTPAWDLEQPVYASGSNKLYYAAHTSSGGAILVVDCARDSFAAALPASGDMPATIVYNPTMDRIYRVGNAAESTVTVVDCAGDSVIARVPVGRSPNALACNPDSNRVYCASYRGDSMFVSAIDCAADSVMGTVFVRYGYYDGSELMCYVPSRDVVVCTTADTAVVVVDGAARQLLGALPAGSSSMFHVDGVSNKLYCLLAGSDELAAIDCRDMSLEARIRLAARLSDMAFDSIADRMWVTSPDYGCISLVDGRTNRFLGLLEAGDSPGDVTWVPEHRRMYVVDGPGQAILVFGDTAVAGLVGSPARRPVGSMATVVRGVLMMTGDRGPKTEDRAELLDVSGRRVLDLLPGANDVSALAPGVYFVRSEPSAAGRQPSAVTKVVITR